MSSHSSLAPIVLFVYNRPWHTKQTLKALQNNELSSESELYIYSDGAKNKQDEVNVNKVRKLVKSIVGFKNINIIEREKNWGLAANIINGVTDIVDKFGKIIVLEDDLVTGKYFLKFLNDGLKLYENECKVSEIIGYSYFDDDKDQNKLNTTFFLKGADCLGWATWKRAWNLFNSNSKELIKILEERNLVLEFNWFGAYNYFSLLKEESEGKVGSWAVKWYASAFINDMLFLVPSRSLVLHIGNEGQGTNYSVKNRKDPLTVKLWQHPIDVIKMDIVQKEISRKAYKRFLVKLRPSIIKRFLLKIQKIIWG